MQEVFIIGDPSVSSFTRAISVLLGVMWKSLPEEDRETFNAEARAQAEERKKIDPDCWKRKRSHSTS